ncbi:aminoglycoside 3'-phosphotransferase [Glutamicibacter mysorens]|uniref:aminoglycoside 3'-phosphotransferase n=1 Tax=Glutamicibacter mysorens TaxID=257984 RepID=UPI0009F92913|nr:aminoglycoside 3'-phosphotransferase [Glutamicibacter mysorens]
MSSTRVISGPPSADHPVPPAVRAAAGPAEIEGIWQNALGGVTYRIGSGEQIRFAKWSPGCPPEAEGDLKTEAQRMTWAGKFIRVPEVLSCEEQADGQLLIPAALHGHSAASSLGKSDPARSAHAVGHGLRQMHDALPIGACPFDWDLESRIQHLPADQQAEFLDNAPELDLVVCHGDACLPNTIITDDHEFSAHVDLGMLGLADRWVDLAIAAWSSEWNYGPGFEQYVYAGYGIEPDERKISFYRRVWDAA